jgi:hypothetical protein
MVVNANEDGLDERGALRFFASKLAPTKDLYGYRGGGHKKTARTDCVKTH